MTDKINTNDEFIEAVADYIENMWDWGIPFEQLSGEEDIVAELEDRIRWVRAHFSDVRAYNEKREKKLSKFRVVN